MDSVSTFGEEIGSNPGNDFLLFLLLHALQCKPVFAHVFAFIVGHQAWRMQFKVSLLIYFLYFLLSKLRCSTWGTVGDSAHTLCFGSFGHTPTERLHIMRYF